MRDPSRWKREVFIVQTIAERPVDDVELILWPERPRLLEPDAEETASGAAAAFAFVAFLSFAVGVALMWFVLL
jgi:hypothetical protein